MIDTPPIALLAFANDRTGQQAYLKEIAEERREIGKLFEEAEREGLCRKEILPDATARDIVDAFQNPAWRDRIVLFHFSGHADSERLLFEAEDGGTAAVAGMDLAAFLGRQASLALVFLNGCATAGHVEALLSAGTQAVIGTRRKVDSIAACRFALVFYRALVQNRSSLRQAYEEAHAGARLIAGASSRGLSYPGHTPVTPALPASLWELHIRPGAEAAANDWRLHDDDPLRDWPLPANLPLPAEPYLNLQSFRREHAGIFFGRGAQIRHLCQLLTHPDTAPIVLLCGQSGVGKSSLLAAGLLPRLESRFAVLHLECTPAHDVAARFTERIGNGETLAAAWRESERTAPRPLLAVLDQAENLLPENGARPEHWQSLLAELAALFGSGEPLPRGKWLLVFRKEWLAEIVAGLDGWKLPHARQILDRLDHAGVVEAVEGVSRNPRCRDQYGLTLRPDPNGRALALHIADDLLGDHHSPVAPTLQILLRRLWDRATAANHAQPVIDCAMYEEEHHRGLLLDDFLRERLAELARLHPPLVESGLALDILHQHTGPCGAAECPIPELEDLYAHDRAGLHAVLMFCKSCFLLADVPMPGRDAPKLSRLAHDTLAPLIRREYERSDRSGQRARRVLEERVRDADSSLLPLEDLPTVERGKSGMRGWTAKETELVKAARSRRGRGQRRRRMLRGALAGLGMMVLLSAAAMAFQWWEGLRFQSRVLAERSRQETDRGHTTLGTLLALEALPYASRIRPWVDSAETALAHALSQPRERTWPARLGQMRDAVFAPDGHLLAVAGERGVELWDGVAGGPAGPAGKMRLRLPQTATVYRVGFSRDGRLVLTAAADCTARVWNAASGLELLRLRHGDEVLRAEFAPRGDAIATLTADGSLHVWSGLADFLAAPGGPPAERAENDRTIRFMPAGTRIRDFAYSPDGARIAVAEDGFVRLLDARGGPELLRLPQRPTALGFSPDGRFLALAGPENAAWVWDTRTGGRRFRLAHDDGVTAVAFSPDGWLLATASHDRSVRVWDMDTGRERLVLAQDSPVWRVAFAADGRTLALVTGAAGIHLRFLVHGLETFRVEHAGSVESAEFSRDGSRIVTASVDGEARVLETRTGKVLFRLTHQAEINHAGFSPDGRLLATAAADGDVRLWDAATGRELVRMAHAGTVRRAVFGPEGGRLLTASDDRTARLWDTASGAERRQLRHDGAVLDAGFSPDGSRIATASADGTVRLWDADSGRERFHWRLDAKVGQAVFSPDGRYLLAAAGAEARVLDLASGAERLRLRHEGSVESAGFSPDGRWIVTASSDHSARIWNADSGEERWRLPHRQELSGAVFSPDGRHVVTSLYENLEDGGGAGALVWDVASGRERFAVPHRATVLQARFSPDGRGLVTVSPDRTARFWEIGDLLQTGRPLVEYAHASGLSRTDLSAEERKRYFLE